MAQKFAPLSPPPAVAGSLNVEPWLPRMPPPSHHPRVLSLTDSIPILSNFYEDPAIRSKEVALATPWQPTRESHIPPTEPDEASFHGGYFEPTGCAVPHTRLSLEAMAKAPGLRRLDEFKAPSELSLRSHLGDLNGVRSGRIFLLRKIQRLGLDSQDAIQKHFSAYGEVDAVLVAHSHVMSPCRRFVRRVRPSNLAIVIMVDEEVVVAIHLKGHDQVINGVPVVVEPFEWRSAAPRDERGKSNRRHKCVDKSGDPSVCRGAGFGGAITAADRKTTVGSSVSTGDSDNATSCESDDNCHVCSDFEYYATDDGF